MKINVEKEFKILVTKEKFNELLSYYPNTVFSSQANTYFDTKEHMLSSMKCAMRIREKENEYVFTLKIPGVDGLVEHSCNVHNNSIESLKTPQIIGLLHSIGIYSDIVETSTLTTKRATVILPEAELCFDISSYNDKVDYEIEYEQTKPHNAKKEFKKILNSVNLNFEKNCMSKIQRSLQKED